MEEKEISPAESLSIIHSMIATAKNKIADDGFYIIFWGWLITLCALAQYVSLKLNSDLGNWVWVIFPPAGGVVSIIYSRIENKTRKVKTYIDTYLGYVWGAFFIGMMLTLFFMPKHGIHATYFSLMVLYGIGTFVTGGLLNYKPLIIGSLFSFAFAIISTFVGEMDQLLCISGALIFSYIIPGHLLRSKYKSEHV